MKKILTIAALAALTFMACDRDEVNTFDSDDACIYFQTGQQTRFYLNIDEYWDTLRYTFSQEDVDVMTHVSTCRLRTLGKVRDYDRPVRVVVDAENTTAVEGVHYKVDLNNVVVPAGAAEVEIPVTFLRDKSLREKEYKLMLKVEDNENFKVPFTRQKNTNIYYSAGDTIMADRFLFMVNEFYSIPFQWEAFGLDALGPWTITKQRVIDDLLGYTAYDWSVEGWQAGDAKILPARFPYIAIKVRNYLQEMADKGTPIKDEDGSYMQLGDNYKVDYSKYY